MSDAAARIQRARSLGEEAGRAANRGDDAHAAHLMNRETSESSDASTEDRAAAKKAFDDAYFAERKKAGW